MKFRPSILAACVVVAVTAGDSRAYDSTGGTRIAGLLSRVEFTAGGSPEFDPPVFEWTEPKRREVAEALAAVLDQMPLDIAELPEIKRVSISNARCSVPPEPGLLRHEPEPRGAEYLRYCGSDTATYYPHERSIAISGTLYALSRGTSLEGRKLLARALQHELTHAWEKDSVTKEFYVLGFERRDEDWYRVLSRNAALYKKHETLAAKAGPGLRAAEQQRLSNLRAALRDSEAAIFQNLGLPLRFGGSTGRIDPTAAPGEDSIDTHSMRTPHEYLAVLAELLWVDPPLALRQYSPEEIAWVERHVFKGRSVRYTPLGL